MNALSRVITAAAELAEYVRPNRMKHITEVKLIEAVDAYRAMPKHCDSDIEQAFTKLSPPSHVAMSIPDATAFEEIELWVGEYGHFRASNESRKAMDVFKRIKVAIRRLATPSATERTTPDPLTLEFAEDLFGCFISGSTWNYYCGICEREIEIERWITAEHEEGCSVAKARDYLAKHKPKCVPGWTRTTDGTAKDQS